MTTATSTLKLEPATLEDCPAITELWFSAFTKPEMRRFWPYTPAIRQWWTDANRHDMIKKPFQKYVKVVDTESVDEQGRPRIVAYAKWDLSMLADRGARWPAWHEEQPGSELDAFLRGLDQDRIRVMGEQKHYCRILPWVCRAC